MSDEAIIQVALTGCVHAKADNPALPVTPEEVRADARRCLDAGAAVLHVHARDERGNPTRHAYWYQRFVDAVRAESAEAVVNVSCSGRGGHVLPEERLGAVYASGADMATLATGSMNFPNDVSMTSPHAIRAMAGEMRRKGVVPELECFEPGHANYALYLIGHGVLKPPHVFNLVLGNLGTCPADLRWLEALVGMLPEGAPWYGTGVGRFARDVAKWALAAGGHVRVGLEDSLWMDEGKTDPATNAKLVERAVVMARALGREPATPAEARRILGL